jgi:putative FmdB family regulatory protein
MPLYAYHCPTCQRSFDVRKTFAEADSPTSCPHCNAANAQRRLANVAIFSASGGGAVRAVAGAPSCSGCAVSGSGCSGCRR